MAAELNCPPFWWCKKIICKIMRDARECARLLDYESKKAGIHLWASAKCPVSF
jgi:hypothetical protein